MTDLPSYQMFVDGKWRDAEGGKTFESFNPATGEAWAHMPAASEADVERAVLAAHRAYTDGPWSRTTASERARYLRRLAELMVQKCEALGRIETTDTGKLYKETRWQANYVADYYHYFAGLADKICGDTLPIDKPDLCALTFREPLGVIAGIVPWNSQMFLVATKLGPALAAGNTIVIKASEQAPAPAFEFAKLVEEAGFPPGVVNILTGFGEPCGRALTTHPLVSRISFTGGTQTARHIVRNSAENFAQISLELGGKSPVMVFEDADLESAANGVVSGIFGASGQTCVAGSRLYLQDGIADEVLATLVDRAGQIRIGDPLDEDTQMGPLATEGQLTGIESQVEAIRQKNGSILQGGRRPSHLNAGWYYEPTIIEGDGYDRDVIDNELFGPVLFVFRFKSEDDVIAKANDTQYGLAAGIFTRDVGRAMRVSKATQSGIVWVNTYRMVSPIAEFGGFKNSGYGRESGFQSIYDYTRTKTVWINTSTEPVANPFVMR